ncbi:MAG: prepilin-type N-terminal cleavage/methylation domain-containing protein [Chthoniobacterales bacterium]
MDYQKTPRALTLIELLAVMTVGTVFASVMIPALWNTYLASSKAVSAHVLQQLSAAGNVYLADNNNVFWKYSAPTDAGMQYWFGLDRSGVSVPEGQRVLDMSCGPLGPYIAMSGGFRHDTSFSQSGTAFKPKYKNGYFAFGYNNLLEDKRLNSLAKPGQTVVFATCAQVNTFQAPASVKRPMLEEFYLINDREYTVHFRHNGKAMVAYANGSVDFLPMDESTRNPRMPTANVGRFAPYGSTRYLK